MHSVVVGCRSLNDGTAAFDRFHHVVGDGTAVSDRFHHVSVFEAAADHGFEPAAFVYKPTSSPTLADVTRGLEQAFTRHEAH